MRFRNKKKDLKIYVVTGTTTVLLSFDIAKSKLDNKQFLGFDIERVDKNGVSFQIKGTKYFDSVHNNPTVTDPDIKNFSPIQSFFWYDYNYAPGETFTYTVRGIFGTALNHQALLETSIKITMEKLQDGQHSVYFNYGVTGSQAYATNTEFGNRPIKSLKGKVLEDALSFLGRELWSDGLLQFVAQAKTKKHKLYCAFYELQYLPFLHALKAAQDRGADVQVVYSAKADQANDKLKNGKVVRLGNVSSIKKVNLISVSSPRKKPSQPHNKFMILFENDKPTQVWTGSTNITPAGIFGQCNTGHWIVDKKIAAKYFEYWQSLKGDPAMGVQGQVSEGIEPDEDLRSLANGTYVFFSPRDLPSKKDVTPKHLRNYADLIDAADEMVCMVLPFNIDDVFKKVYREDKNYLRFLIFEKTSEAFKVQSNDIDLKITGGAVLDDAVEQWAKEETAKQSTDAGILYVHNKFFIIDALSDDPIVITGSANFSINSIQNNDENSIMVKGNRRVADIYLTEFNRLFVHFWPRYLYKLNKKKKRKLGFDKPLDETFTWHEDYFDPAKFGFKRKQMFIKMKSAKNG